MRPLQILLLALVLVGGCTCKDEMSLKEQVLAGSELQGQNSPERAEFTKQVLDKIIYSIPSPIEFTFLLKEIGAEYSEEMLNPVENADHYASNYKKAINLGVYGADLGYVNFYDKTQTSLSYLSTIKQLAEEQQIGQFFDIETLSRLASERENMDSLMYTTMTSFDQIDRHLRKHNRGDLSVFMLIGGWLEGLHLAAQIAKHNPNQTLVDVIGAQIYVLDDLNQLLADYKGEGELRNLINQLLELKAVFDASSLEITAPGKKTISKVVDGKVVIQNIGGGGIQIDAAALERVVTKIEQIRGEIIRS